MEGIVLSFQDEPEEDHNSLLRYSRTLSALKSETIFAHGARQSILNEIRRKCLISVTSSARMRWDLFILLLTVINSFTVPFEIAFLGDEIDTIRLVINLVVTGAYIVDILVQCRSTYLNESGAEITNAKIIAAQYFYSGKLVMDVLAAIPYEFLDLINNTHIRLFSLLKMLRLLRLSKIIRFMRTNDKTKLKMELVQLIMIFLLFLHLQACFWFMLTNASAVYIPPAQYLGQMNMFREGIGWQYAYSLYMSVYLLTAAEIGPRTVLERLAAGGFILLGQLFQAFMFGKIAVVLFNLNAKNAEQVEIQDAAATTMMHMRLPSQLQSKVLAYLTITQADTISQVEFEDFFRVLPPSLQQEVLCVIFKRSLMLDTGLSSHPALFNSVLRRLTNLYCQPEMSVIVQGDEGTELYFVMKGMCEVAVLDEHKEEHHVALLGRGTHFGEIALVYNSVRTASVRAHGHATLAVLSKKDFNVLSQRDRRIVTIFRETAVKYQDPWRQYLISTLMQCRVLRNVPTSVLKEMSYSIKPTHIEGNSFICKEGDIADCITFIIDGTVEIYVPMNDMRLMSFPSDPKLARDLQISHKLRFRRGSLLALKKTKDMRYIVKISMDNLGMGSVILPNLPLIQEKVTFYAKTTERTAVLSLNTHLLSSLCKQFPDLSEAVRSYRQILQNAQTNNAIHFINQMALDYEKCISPSATHVEHCLWNAKMTLRRCVMGRIVRQRGWKNRGCADLASMSRKIRTIVEVENSGDVELAEKVRRAAMPGNGKIVIRALKLLTKEEAGKPLIAQIAYQASRTRFSMETWKSELLNLSEQCEMITALRVLLQDDLERLRLLVQLSLRLNSI